MDNNIQCTNSSRNKSNISKGVNSIFTETSESWDLVQKIDKINKFRIISGKISRSKYFI